MSNEKTGNAARIDAMKAQGSVFGKCAEGPIYLLTEEEDGAVLRIEPAQ